MCPATGKPRPSGKTSILATHFISYSALRIRLCNWGIYSALWIKPTTLWMLLWHVLCCTTVRLASSFLNSRGRVLTSNVLQIKLRGLDQCSLCAHPVASLLGPPTAAETDATCLMFNPTVLQQILSSWRCSVWRLHIVVLFCIIQRCVSVLYLRKNNLNGEEWWRHFTQLNASNIWWVSNEEWKK